VPGVDQAAKVQAARAVAICDGAAWEAAATMYRNNHAKEAGPFGFLKLPDDFPAMPFPCNPTRTADGRPITAQTATQTPLFNRPQGATMTWAGPGNWSWSATPDNAPGGFYLGGSFGGTSSNTHAANPTVFTIGILDNTAIAPMGTGHFISGGVFAGANVAQALGFLFGVEFGADFADKNQTTITNINNTTTGTTGDRLAFEYNHILSLSGVITAPITSKFSVFGKGGGSWMNGTAHTTCAGPGNGSCGAVPTPAYNVATDVDFSGYHLGFGVQGRVGTLFNRSVFLRGEWTRHWFDSQRVSTGNPATASIAWDATPEIDQFKASLIVPLGGIPNGGPMSWSAPGSWSLSDIRLKRDIVKVGQLDNGLALYRYKYLATEREYVGVMAQDVQKVMPDAVQTASDGFLRVNYAKLGIKAQTWDEYQWSQTAAVQAAKRDCPAANEDFSMIVAALPDLLPVTR
jgi:hypothetical protein